MFTYGKHDFNGFIFVSNVRINYNLQTLSRVLSSFTPNALRRRVTPHGAVQCRIPPPVWMDL